MSIMPEQEQNATPPPRQCPFKDRLAQLHQDGGFEKITLPEVSLTLGIDPKTQLYSLLKVATEDVWRKIQTSLGSPEDNILRSLQSSQKLPVDRVLTPIEREELLDLLLLRDSNPKVACMISGLVGKFFTRQIRDAIYAIDKRPPNDQPEWYEPLKRNLKGSMFLDNRSGVCAILGSGFTTARKVFWNSYGILPDVFEQEMNRTASVAELASIGQRSHGTFLRLAGAHISVLTSTVESLHGITPDYYDYTDVTDYPDRTFNPSQFKLTSRNPDKARLEPRGELIPVASPSPVSNTWLGCPALAARGTLGLNVISEFLSWSHRVAEDLYFPAIKLE